MSTRGRRVPAHPGGGVCVCWFHPLALSDFRRLLSGNGVRVAERRLDANTAGVDLPRLPPAGVYVLEGHMTAAVTEAIVEGFLSRSPTTRFLVVAERFEQEDAFSLLRLGVKGLMTFDEAPSTLRRAVKEIDRDGFWASRALLSRFIDSTLRSLSPRTPSLLGKQARLSRRENQVRGLLLENLSNREIADRLSISERTAKFHVSNLLGKYGLKRRADLVVLSYSRFPTAGLRGTRRSSPVRAG